MVIIVRDWRDQLPGVIGKMMTGEEIYKAAIHEAGHAVASMRLFDGKFPGKISLVLKNGLLESHASEKLFFYSDKRNERGTELRKKAIYACAGYAALRLTGYSPQDAETGCGQDFEIAVNLTWQSIDELKEQAVAFMNKPGNIIAIRLIADELMQKKKLSYEEISTLVAVADIQFVTSERNREHAEH